MPESLMQPVMLVTDERVMCECGNVAIFLLVEGDDYTSWCQTCFELEEEEEG